ncbi:SRPBCC family protein [Mesorhizobium sp. 1B3]|uniref:SRPBCC family protein n=1 Tax=Mesorhizobium sp. 1B3 TaxID=3243599 RepID=UPI003D95B837
MPIKKDGTGRRWVEMEFLAPGTPEQIWQAMATGPGNSSWFTRTTIEGHVGGALRFEFGAGMSTTGEVTFWEPPHRFSYVEHGWNGDAPPVATEITIAARSGDRCIVRMVHSLFSSSDEWDDQLESFEGGWPGFFEVLRLYLSHFAGMKGASFQVMAQADGEALAVWSRLTQALGVAGADVGEQRTATSGPEELSGTVERLHQERKQRYVMLRLHAPRPAVLLAGIYAMGEQINASVSFFFYSDDADETAAASEPLWRDWLTGAVQARPG